MPPIQFLLLPLGSAGDVHPLIWIGKRLQERGHAVTMIIEDAFLQMPQRAGIPTIPLGKKEEQEAVIRNPDIWHPRKAFDVVAKHLPAYIREPLAIFEKHKDDKRTVLITGTLALAGRIAHERWGIPHLVVHLQPSTFMSIDQSPVMVAHGEALSKLPRFIRKILMHYVDRVVDKKIGPPVNALRAEWGLTTPANKIMRTWWHAPDGVIALFPDWYARKAPDWPPQTHLTRFPLYDQSEDPQSPLDPALANFLTQHPKPFLFTPGSANAHGRNFFHNAHQALLLLQKPGIFLTPYADQLPPHLPPTIAAFPYVPFSQVFPKCAAVIHHGGIGTCAQAMAAGVPQLIMPLAHDQPDNANRLKRLGIGDFLYPKKFKPKAIARKLTHLTTTRETAFACQGIQQHIQSQMSPDKFCALIESLSETALSKRLEPIA